MRTALLSICRVIALPIVQAQATVFPEETHVYTKFLTNGERRRFRCGDLSPQLCDKNVGSNCKLS